MTLNIKHSLFFVIFVLLGGVNSFGREFEITPKTDVHSIVKQAKPGDELILSPGIWRDLELRFDDLRGTESAPIRIAAKVPGRTIFTGESQLAFSGEYVEVSGLVFRNTDSSDVLQLRSHSKRLARHCRVSDCFFEQTKEAPAGRESRWLSIYGRANRVDHCEFRGKRSRGTTLVVWVNEGGGKHVIEHNFFGPRPPLGKNGGETIRIGTSDVSELTSHTTVRDNFFFECDGEAEVVSNKSCQNTYHHNWFEQCAGSLTLRHGHRCLVDANVFRGNGRRGTGGVRIIGRDHTVSNNYFEGLRGDAERATIALMNGIPNSPLNQYAPVERATVANNTMIDCKVSFELGVGASKKQSEAARSCLFARNLVMSGKWGIFRVKVPPIDTNWIGNLQQTTRKEPSWKEFASTSIRLERAADGLLRPRQPFAELSDEGVPKLRFDSDGNSRVKGLVGCDDPAGEYYDWPKRPEYVAKADRDSCKSIVGPSWKW